MKSNDLRIGNWYTAPNGKYTILTLELLKEIIDLDWFDEIEPIELNEDWLNKFVFDFIIEDGVKHYTDLECNLTICYKKIFLWQYNQGIEIKYVHQLQNIYFKITESKRF